MGGMSIWHLLIIAFILLMIFGPSRIGEMGGSLGKAIRNFKKGLDGADEIDVTTPPHKEQISGQQQNTQTKQTSTESTQAPVKDPNKT